MKTLFSNVTPRVLAGLLLCAVSSGAMAADGQPDFSSDGVGWIASLNDFIAPTSGPGPVTSDPEHPYIPNGTGQQPTFRVADLNNPILMPWVKDELKKVNERVLAGGTAFTRANRCWPAGVPTILLIRIQPVFFVQTPKEVWMMWQNDHQVRRIYLNQEHSADVKPSWFGESVGHYEGDSLVVDTIGVSTKTTVDNYSTPHTDKLHVVERYRMIEGGKTLQVDVTVEDTGAFTAPWHAIQRYRRVQEGAILEDACAENSAIYSDLYSKDVGPIPTADKPDF